VWPIDFVAIDSYERIAWATNDPIPTGNAEAGRESHSPEQSQSGVLSYAARTERSQAQWQSFGGDNQARMHQDAALRQWS
jgi:hypothetical protein